MKAQCHVCERVRSDVAIAVPDRRCPHKAEAITARSLDGSRMVGGSVTNDICATNSTVSRIAIVPNMACMSL